MRTRLVPDARPRSRLSGFSDASTPPQVSARTDGSIASMSLSGRTWSFGRTDLVRFRTWNTITRTLTTWTPADCTTFVADAGGFTATILGGTVTITGSLGTEGEDFAPTLAVTNAHSSVAVYSIQYPRLLVQPPSGVAANAYLTIPIWAGFVKREPSLDTTDRYVSAPSCLGFFSYFDKVAAASLYMEKRDDDGYVIDWHYQGDPSTGETLLYVEHFCGPNKTAGNDWTQPYEMRIAGLTTKGDGRSAYIDAAQRYAQWALETDGGGAYVRPWVPSAYWWLRSDYSTRVRDAKLFIAHQDGVAIAATGPTPTPPSWSGYRTDLQRTKSFIGSPGSDILNVIYAWHGNVFDVDVPALTPSRSGYAAHLANVVTDGAVPIPYVNVAYWDLDLTSGTYNVTNFSPFGDVRAYLCKDDDQSIRQDAGHAAIVDPSFAITPTVWLALVSLYYAEAVTAPRGYYFDQIGGTQTSLAFNYSSALASTGNSGAWATGKRTGMNSLMTVAKSLDPQACAITEQFEEAVLGLEATLSCQNVDITTGLGAMCGATFAVYGQFIRHLDFTVQIADPSSPGGALGYAQQVIAHWLGGGLLGYHNGSVGSFAPALSTGYPSTDSALWYTFVVIKALYDAASRVQEPFRGREQRPLSNSWQYRAIDDRNSLAAYVSGNQISFPSSVWKTDDGKLWIIVVNHLATTDPFTLSLRCSDYGLPDGRERTLAMDTGSGFVDVASVVDVVSYTATITNPVTVFRITTS